MEPFKLDKPLNEHIFDETSDERLTTQEMEEIKNLAQDCATTAISVVFTATIDPTTTMVDLAAMLATFYYIGRRDGSKK